MVTDEHLADVATTLWLRLYESPFRGKKRGAFALSRKQLLTALKAKRLDPDLFDRFHNTCLVNGLYIANLDGQFPCVGLDEIAGLRKVPNDTFDALFEGSFGIEAFDEDEDDDD